MAVDAARSRTNHRRRILDAAAEIFLRNGFTLSSTAEIAQRAKISKRELYAHFAGKGAILAAVFARLQNDIQSQLNISWSSNDDLHDVLTQVGTAILKFIHSERFGKLCRIVAAETFRDPVSARRAS